MCLFFFFNDPATTEIYTLSLHDALPICSPTVNTGFSEVIGSWKIIAISLPRIRRISAGESCSRSVPSKRICPSTIFPGGSGIRRRIDKADGQILFEGTDLLQ